MRHDSNFSGDLGEFRPSADINVTPLVDVMLVLLVIFMITAPMLATGMKVNLPSSSSAAPLDTVEPIVVSIGANSIVSVGVEIVPKQEVVAAVLRQTSGDKARAIQLRGDTLATYGDVVFVLGELAKNGISKIAIETAFTAEK